MGHLMKSLIFLAFSLQVSSAATHFRKLFITGVTPGISFPEFTGVGQVDEERIGYYDSNIGRLILTANWINKSSDAEYWEMISQRVTTYKEDIKDSLASLMKLFNQTEGVHTVQRMFGCELDDDGTKRGYFQSGYDGEDFISLDLNTGTWTAANAKAVPAKLMWEKTGVARFRIHFLENECIEWLKKYVDYGRSILERKVPPEVSLFQKDFSSPVVCHATGFFPKSVIISWLKNGKELPENGDLGQTLPNEDGSFQKRSVLTVSPEELNRNKYTCVVLHEGVEKKLQVSDIRVLSGGGSVGNRIGVVVAVILLVLMICAAVFLWKKKKSGFYTFSSSSNS